VDWNEHSLAHKELVMSPELIYSLPTAANLVTPEPQLPPNTGRFQDPDCCDLPAQKSNYSLDKNDYIHKKTHSNPQPTIDNENSYSSILTKPELDDSDPLPLASHDNECCSDSIMDGSGDWDISDIGRIDKSLNEALPESRLDIHPVTISISDLDDIADLQLPETIDTPITSDSSVLLLAPPPPPPPPSQTPVCEIASCDEPIEKCEAGIDSSPGVAGNTALNPDPVLPLDPSPPVANCESSSGSSITTRSKNKKNNKPQDTKLLECPQPHSLNPDTLTAPCSGHQTTEVSSNLRDVVDVGTGTIGPQNSQTLVLDTEPEKATLVQPVSTNAQTPTPKKGSAPSKPKKSKKKKAGRK
ncbi:hypothetical protein AYI68_g3731, partial [Smittium mucronatum]